MSKHIVPLVALFLSLLFFASAIAPAAWSQVYKWQDKNGVTHYSSKPQSKDAKPAKLPPLLRDDKKPSLPKVISCTPHGGINCAAGPDTDGSVICYDGFRDATARFRFNCTAAKLEVTRIEDAEHSFNVFVRNTKSVPAESVRVTLIGEGTALAGPKTIEAYGVGEYKWLGNAAPETPDPGQISIYCSTCP